MAAHFESKHGTVSRSKEELYMSFTDLRAFTAMLPEDKKSMINATADTLQATVQGFTIGVKVTLRQPYSLIEIQDDGSAPFKFALWFHFDEDGVPGKTDFHIAVEADLNLMMKMMLGSKIQEGLDKIVDGLVDASEGRMPQGFNL